MKKLLIIIGFSLFLRAEVLDEIKAVVNNIPITSYDIQKIKENKNIGDKDALNYLIQKSLIESEIKKNGISVDDFEIENAMEKVANSNGMSLYEFKSILLQRGEYEKFKNQLKESLLREKLFNQIVKRKLNISLQEVKNYYDTHKNEFSIFKTIQVTKYSANNSQVLKEIQKNPLLNIKVNTQTQVFSYEELPLNLLFLFKNTKVGEFTPIVNDGMNYVNYYVARKDGKVILPFEKVKNIIFNKLVAQKRENILKDYFAKLKNRAYIKIYN
ncbi:MAG: hypothetical protein ABGX26_03455 [Nautiliaceae bacterium]